MIDAGYWMLDTGCWILGIGYWVLVTGLKLETGCWKLVEDPVFSGKTSPGGTSREKLKQSLPIIKTRMKINSLEL